LQILRNLLDIEKRICGHFTPFSFRHPELDQYTY